MGVLVNRLAFRPRRQMVDAGTTAAPWMLSRLSDGLFICDIVVG